MSLVSSNAFLDELSAGPEGLVLWGEAGIGKTILWQAGVVEARGRYEHVLSCRGVEAEAALSVADLSELLSDVLRALAQRSPLLVAVDDVQSLDAGSTSVLEVALRRLRNDPIGVLLAARRTAVRELGGQLREPGRVHR